jgi:hypothetical protein
MGFYRKCACGWQRLNKRFMVGEKVIERDVPKILRRATVWLSHNGTVYLSGFGPPEIEENNDNKDMTIEEKFKSPQRE